MGEADAVISIDDLGNAVRASRERHALTQADLAGLSGTGIRFISDLERGKPRHALDGLARK
jgi:transcriptional regulator with XRE-family HTH domain